MTTTGNNIMGKTNKTTVAFAAALLLFLLPFFNIKCNDVKMASITGVDMVMGGEPTVSKDLENMQKGFGDTNNVTSKEQTKKEGKVYIAALLAFILGGIGLVLSMSRKSNQKTIMIIGVLAAVGLIIAWLQVSSSLKSEMNKGENAGDLSGMMNISAQVTFWFIACLLCFLAAAYFCYQQTKLIAIGEAPPANAPQIHLENPGDQSSFPAAPTDERHLG